MPRVAPRQGIAWRSNLFQAAALGVAAIALLTVLRLGGRGTGGVGLDFSFLLRPAGFAIGETLISYRPSDSYARAIVVGLLNTIAVAGLGCVLAVVLGFVLGAVRLSDAPLAAGLVRGYVEVARNSPLLLQLFFWSGLVHALPPPRTALTPLPGVVLTNRGLILPSATFDIARFTVATAAGFALACLLVVAVSRVRGGPVRRAWLVGFGACVALPIGLLLGTTAWQVPHLRGFNFVGGLTISPEMVALTVALVAHSAAIVSEIVRGAVLGVPSGQRDAALAIGLRERYVMWLVVLPQALRAMIPPLVSACLSLTKSTSLAVAIGYPELVSVLNTTGSQTGQQLEVILLMAGAYLALNLLVSAALSSVNRRQLRWNG